MSHIARLTALVLAVFLLMAAFSGVVFFFGREYVRNEYIPKKERPAVWMPLGEVRIKGSLGLDDAER